MSQSYVPTYLEQLQVLDDETFRRHVLESYDKSQLDYVLPGFKAYTICASFKRFSNKQRIWIERAISKYRYFSY